MSDDLLYVQDIIDAPPCVEDPDRPLTLRERAKAAYEAQKLAQEAEFTADRDNLERALRDFLRDEMGAKDYELRDAKVTYGRVEGVPPRPIVYMRINEGSKALSFKATLAFVGGEMERKYEVSWTSQATSYQKVESLEQLGSRLP